MSDVTLQLYGTVIGSTADADKNRLDTGTLGWSDIKNEAEYKVQHQSVGISTGGSIGNQFAGNMANGLLTGVNNSGSADSTTKAAVSDGTIVIRDQHAQKQDVADLSRDVENANPGLGQIFDKEKEQNRLKEAQLIGQIGAQVGDIARTQGQIEATKAGKAELAAKGVKEPGENATKEERAAWNKALTETSGYKTAQQQWGTGSAIQQGIQAATAAVQGLAGGNIAQAVSGAAAPYLAEQIHNMTTTKGPDGKDVVNTQANLMAHAVVGAVTSWAAGNSALAGASGAVMGEYIAQQMYPGVDRKDLTEEQRQTISALGTLAAGLAGGVVGDSTADAVAGAQAGKNALENNNLILPAPVPVPGVPVGPGHQVKLDADKQIASGLDGALKDIGEAIDKATQCSFGRACSEDTGDNNANQPNIGKDLTDAEKTELGGAGSGTGTPPSENDSNQQSNKPVQKLNQKQESSIKKIDNLVRNSVKDHDITGTLKDMNGNPIIKPDGSGKYWNHMKEMQDTLNGLRNHANTLKSVNNPEAQAAYGRANDAINKLESAIKGYGI
jgi:filamentous hemagglutinin